MLYDTPNQPQLRPRRSAANGSPSAAYNAAFAAALADEAAGGPGAAGVRAMVQDYHLTLVPRMLAELAPATSGSRTSRTPRGRRRTTTGCCPTSVGREVLDGHPRRRPRRVPRRRWADAFLDCCARVPRRARWTAAARHGQLTAGTSPASACTRSAWTPPTLRQRAAAADVQAQVAALDRRGGRPEADRPGGPHRAVQEHRPRPGRLPGAADHPARVARPGDAPGASPTRPGTTCPSTASTPPACSGWPAEIEDEFGTDDWNPLILQVNDDYPRSLAAYRLADVLLVNPIRDGMNLVAKEGPILSERGCALVLSREAGAAARTRRRRAAGQPVRRDRDGRGPARGADHARRRTPPPQRGPGRRRRGLPPARWLGDQLAALDR